MCERRFSESRWPRERKGDEPSASRLSDPNLYISRLLSQRTSRSTDLIFSSGKPTERFIAPRWYGMLCRETSC